MNNYLDNEQNDELFLQKIYSDQILLLKSVTDGKYAYESKIKKAAGVSKKISNVIELGKQIPEKIVASKLQSGIYTNMGTAYQLLSLITDKTQNLESACRCFKKAIEINPMNKSAPINLIVACMEKGDVDSAVQLVSQLSLESVTRLGEYYIENNIEYLITAHNEEQIDQYDKLLRAIDERIGLKIGIRLNVISVYLMNGYYTNAYHHIVSALDKIDRDSLHVKYKSQYIILMHSYAYLAKLIPDFNCDNALQHINKALQLSDSQNYNQLLYDKALILIEKKGYDEAKSILMNLLEDDDLLENTLFMLARVLYEKKELDKALEYIQLAESIVEDDASFHLEGNIYHEMGKYDKAVDCFVKGLELSPKRFMIYTKDNGKPANSFATPEVEEELYNDLIKALTKQGNYKDASLYLAIAKRKYPEQNVLKVWATVLPQLTLQEQVIQKKEKELQKASEEYQKCAQTARNWAKKLIRLKMNSNNIDFDNEEDWDQYENQINDIISEMEKDSESKAYLQKNIRKKINKDFQGIHRSARQFLITAEFLYEYHKNNSIDFGPIVLEYAKVLEQQLRYKLGNSLSEKIKMLGQILQHIEENEVYPYITRINDMRDVHRLRNNSAHTGVLSKQNVDEIRGIYFNKHLLNNLMQ